MGTLYRRQMNRSTRNTPSSPKGPVIVETTDSHTRLQTMWTMTDLRHNRERSHPLRVSALKWLRVMAVVAALPTVGSFQACFASAQKSEGIVGMEQQSALRSSLVGEWISVIGGREIALRLTTAGDFSFGNQKGRYVVEADTVILNTDTSEVSYQFELAGKELTLSGGDLKQPLRLTRMRGLGDYEGWLSYLSPRSLLPRFKRIAVITVIVVSCRVFLWILQMLSRFAIHSDWAPLKFAYGRNKNRTMTMHSLVLNGLKYAVYLIAFGFILTELGINYTAYLASLSVVGLAIGFGSQGLVQDMVTGFFIVFEEQFNVGDMVEIPPHVGIVQELGLRMTRLRNYLGQTVVIPNRNIATVGNYRTGAQQVSIDVAAPSQDAAEQMGSHITQVAGVIAGQFEEVILTTSKTCETVSLSTGEHFARLSLAIWPQQQWVIEQEVVPRIRSVLRNKGFEIPNDRVSISYHPREQQSVGIRPRGEADGRFGPLKSPSKRGQSRKGVGTSEREPL